MVASASSPELNQRLMSAVRKDSGSFEIYSAGPGIMVSRASGRLDLEMAETWVRCGEEHLQGPHPIAMFHDWSQLESYDSATRQRLTKWVLDHRTRVEGGWFLTGSRLVAMGVAVAGSATAVAGVPLHASLRREQWEELLRAKQLERSG